MRFFTSLGAGECGRRPDEGLDPGLRTNRMPEAPHLSLRDILSRYRERKVRGGSAVTRQRNVTGSFSRTASFLSPVFHAKPLHTFAKPAIAPQRKSARRFALVQGRGGDASPYLDVGCLRHLRTVLSCRCPNTPRGHRSPWFAASRRKLSVSNPRSADGD